MEEDRDTHLNNRVESLPMDSLLDTLRSRGVPTHLREEAILPRWEAHLWVPLRNILLNLEQAIRRSRWVAIPHRREATHRSNRQQRDTRLNSPDTHHKRLDTLLLRAAEATQHRRLPLDTLAIPSLSSLIKVVECQDPRPSRRAREQRLALWEPNWRARSLAAYTPA